MDQGWRANRAGGDAEQDHAFGNGGRAAPLDAGLYCAKVELRLHQHQSCYQRSPVHTMYETQQWLGSNLTQHTARDYGIFQE
jgi:hypothetical protein